MNYKKSGTEPADHAIGRSRGGLTTKSHLVCDGKGRALAFVVTGGQVADTSMLATTLEQISVAGARGRPRTRPQRSSRMLNLNAPTGRAAKPMPKITRACC